MKAHHLLVLGEVDRNFEGVRMMADNLSPHLVVGKQVVHQLCQCPAIAQGFDWVANPPENGAAG